MNLYEMEVLITDGAYKHALAVVRSLGKKGVNVTVSSHLRHSMSFFSKYCKRRVLTPYPGTEVFTQALIKEIKNERYDVLLPIGSSSCISIFDLVLFSFFYSACGNEQ